ncbi:MAG: glutamate-cysteine ligase family protein [Actinomycetes bacterium]
MGEEVRDTVFTREDRQRYREKVHRCLDVLERMLAQNQFDFDDPLTGMEIELNLVDDHGDPAMRNAEVLELIDDPAFQTELGRFNLEINVPPGSLAGEAMVTLEEDVRSQLNAAQAKAREAGAGMVMIGILPTLLPEHVTHEALSANPRYALLDQQILRARGEDLHLSIEGVDAAEDLDTYTDTIGPEAACTSLQLHVQVSPEAFAANWNAAQCLAGVQVALGANSPYFLGKELWRESRIAVFTQATDTRSVELKAQGVRPRVWFGERYITSVFDLFEENLRYFPALLPVLDDEDPVAVHTSGGTPSLAELRLHNGTVYRWNRPVYDVVAGRPHLRVENRVLPAGPTVVDVLANAAFYYGTLRMLAEGDRPVWSQMSFQAAADNFTSGATRGIDAEVYWPGYGEVPVTELVLRRLLPLAHEGLERWGVDRAVRDRLLGIVERRCTSGRNGASWQVERVHELEAAGSDRLTALRAMTHEYAELMHENVPVHSWPNG